MVLRGRIVNRPSDSSGQREVSSAIIVHAGPDPDEPDPRLPRSVSPLESLVAVGEETSPDSAELSLEDPASTGGLLDALARGGFGGPKVDLEGGLDKALKRFRRAVR